jgi:hypothetical protein
MPLRIVKTVAFCDAISSKNDCSSRSGLALQGTINLTDKTTGRLNQIPFSMKADENEKKLGVPVMQNRSTVLNVSAAFFQVMPPKVVRCTDAFTVDGRTPLSRVVRVYQPEPKQNPGLVACTIETENLMK